MNDNRFYGMYRGIVKDNTGEQGQVKIYVPTVYPSDFENVPANLPWAEPAQALYGGNYMVKSDKETLNFETGICGWPKVGAHVWVFFDQGDHNYPIYFASSQGSTGWISEHNKQWTLHTDNVRIRIDEDPSNSKSSSKFNSYNSKCTHLSIPEKQTKMPTTLDIEVKGNVNIKIKGNVNLQIEGNVYEEITGEVHKTHIGNLFEKHVGDSHIVHEGSSIIEHEGDIRHKQKGDFIITRTGNETRTVTGSKNETITKVDSLNVFGQYTEMITNKSSKVVGLRDETTIGDKLTYVDGNNTETTTGDKQETIVKNNTTIIKGANIQQIVGKSDIVCSSIYSTNASQIRLN